MIPSDRQREREDRPPKPRCCRAAARSKQSSAENSYTPPRASVEAEMPQVYPGYGVKPNRIRGRLLGAPSGPGWVLAIAICTNLQTFSFLTTYCFQWLGRKLFANH